jgi:hypothetical protein
VKEETRHRTTPPPVLPINRLGHVGFPSPAFLERPAMNALSAHLDSDGWESSKTNATFDGDLAFIAHPLSPLAHRRIRSRLQPLTVPPLSTRERLILVTDRQVRRGTPITRLPWMVSLQRAAWSKCLSQVEPCRKNIPAPQCSRRASSTRVPLASRSLLPSFPMMALESFLVKRSWMKEQSILILSKGKHRK